MRLVLPFDGSPSAARAVDYVVDYAQRLAEDARVDVDLVNVQTPDAGLSGMGRDAVEVGATLTAAARDNGARVLAAPLDKLRAANIAAHSTVLVGEPAEEIAAYAHDRRCEAIVMGTRGLGAVGGLLLGSTASKVVRLADMPVTLVK